MASPAACPLRPGENSGDRCERRFARAAPFAAAAIRPRVPLRPHRGLPRRLDAELARRRRHELAHAVLLPGGDHEILGRRLLQHQPHRARSPGRGPSRAARRGLPEVQAVVEPDVDARERPGDLPGDEGLAAHRRFVVEENSVAGVDPVGLAIVDGDPVAVELGHAVRRAGVERRRLRLRRLLDEAEHLGGRRLVEARLAGETEDTNRPAGAACPWRRSCRVLRLLERDRRRLCAPRL